MTDILFAVLPVFLIIGVGMVVDRIAFLPSTTSMILNVYVLRLALPVLLLRIMAGAEPGELFQGRVWLGLLSSQLLLYVVAYAGDLLLARRGRGPAVVTAMTCSSAMTAFIGLPIVVSLFPGDREALVAAGLLAVMPTVTIALGQSQLEVERQREQGVLGGVWMLLGRAVLLNPLVIGTLIGSALCVGGVGLWAPLDRAAALIGATASPCVLLALGLDIRNKLSVGIRGRGGHMLARQGALLTLKLVVHPLLTWGMMLLCGVSGVWLAVSVIMSATAVAVGSYVVAEVYKAVPEECALGVVLTNAFSLFTLPLFAYAFKALGIL